MYSVLVCGSNGNYQLGIDNDVDQSRLTYAKFLINNFITTSIPSRPIDIICGGNHTFILMENGDVYAAGDNSFGQLAIPTGTATQVKVFTKIPKKYSKIAAGWEYSILVDTENEVYVCGKGPKGELGLGNSVKQCELTKLPHFQGKISCIKTCLNHTILILNDGSIYGWGVSRNGKLGITHEKILSTPTRLTFTTDDKEDKILHLNLARDFTIINFEHKGIKIYGKFAQEFKIPSENLANKDIESIQTMWSSNHFKLSNKAEILSIGNNSHGQLFPGARHRPVDEFTVGSEHGLIKSHNEVFAWGWGEHGNCGRINKPGEVIVGYLNQIYHGQDKVEFIRAGCATSWVVVS